MILPRKSIFSRPHDIAIGNSCSRIVDQFGSGIRVKLSKPNRRTPRQNEQVPFREKHAPKAQKLSLYCWRFITPERTSSDPRCGENIEPPSCPDPDRA
ncbi:hypothetical protein MES4922_10250 [Mesorhizobium ventifaucium]|uniref:Uncharacterized protein n=1 Tax=Mesorhizobium ventifaucium TaxID=666020 RepID=A0ABM9DE09_9HYPH|nr:hypothetical protein MES4922_10250 [Mesorhizobium ventifaucium]